jgi:hypothetical protein
LLRDQVFPEGTKYRFVIRTLWGPDSYDVVAKDTTEASVKLAKRLRMTEAELASILDEVWEYKTGQWVKIFPTETKEWREAFPETLRLKPLFDMQDSLIEHKFPHEKSAIIDWIISCPSDIYRNMTHGYPDFGYVMEKWERLNSYAARPPLSKLQANDWEEIKEQINEPTYKERRDQYLGNLVRLREETVKMPMDPKRSAVMVESLDMIKALIFWFESQDSYEPPRQQLSRLTDAVHAYFPREFFEGARVQIPPDSKSQALPSVMVEALFRAASSVESLTSGLRSQFGHELKEMITEAEREKREVGVMLCCSPSGDIHLSRTCYGRRETVMVRDCHDGRPLGSFHAHTGGIGVFSVPDLELAIRKEQLSCLGYMKAGAPMLKCITPKRYYELPSESKAWVKRSLDQARQDIETATRLFRESMTSSEAIALSQRAKAVLSNIEQLLGAYEVQL